MPPLTGNDGTPSGFAPNAPFGVWGDSGSAGPFGPVPPEIFKALQSGDPPPTGLSSDETRAFEQIKVQFAKRRAYAQIMGTRPQTLSALADSPAGLAAWLLDHGDGYGQPAAAITSRCSGARSMGTLPALSHATTCSTMSRSIG
jgi:hypothetical protein